MIGSFRGGADLGIWKWGFQFYLPELDPGVHWCLLRGWRMGSRGDLADLVSDQAEGLESRFRCR